MKNFEVDNLSERPLWLRLNSGSHLCIPPRCRSGAIDDYQLLLNPQLEKLTASRTVRVYEIGEPSGSDKARSGKRVSRR